MKYYTDTDGFYRGIYTRQDLIEQLNLTEVPTPPTEGLVKPRWINSEWVETATPQEIEAFQQSQLDDIISQEKQRYIQRMQDGQIMYARLSAEFRLAKVNGQINEAAHRAIEDTLRPVREEVLAGQWISGLENLVAIGSANIGQELYDRLHQMITNYISQNY